MSKAYYFVNIDRDRARKIFEKKVQSLLNSTKNNLIKYIESNEQYFEDVYDLEYDAEEVFKKFENELSCIVPEKDIYVCNSTMKEVNFYRLWEVDGREGFHNLKTLEVFFKKYKEEWVLQDECGNRFKSFDKFLEDAGIKGRNINKIIRW